MSTQLIPLRNTISGQVYDYPEKTAERILAHPVWGKVNVIATTDKPEVLAQPYVVDENNERESVSDDEEAPIKPSNKKVEK